MGGVAWVRSLCTLSPSLQQPALTAVAMPLASSNVRVGMSIALNLVSAISIVFLNKTLYVSYAFPSMTLTLIHFIITSLGLQICVWFNVFSPKRLVLTKILPLSASFCGFVVLTNLSLQSNAVGTYQLAKSMTTPTILFIQAVFYKMASPLKIKLTVVIIYKWEMRVRARYLLTPSLSYIAVLLQPYIGVPVSPHY